MLADDRLTIICRIRVCEFWPVKAIRSKYVHNMHSYDYRVGLDCCHNILNILM